MKGLLLGLVLFSPLQGYALSHDLWVAGTRPYETVPYYELDLEGQSYLSGAQGPLWTGVLLEYGILDHWMLSGAFRDASDGREVQSYELESRLRFGEAGQWPLDLAVFAEIGYETWNNPCSLCLSPFPPIFTSHPDPTQPGSARLGLVVSRGFWENEVSLNFIQILPAAFEFRAGWRSPYFFWALRTGIEAAYMDLRPGLALTPQLVVQLPGDIGIQAGYSFMTEGQERGLWLRISYELFPSP